MNETEKQIAEYRAAYKAANGFDIRDEITYEKGWFVFRRIIDGKVFLLSRYRRHSLLTMTSRLNSRAGKRQYSPAKDD